MNLFVFDQDSILELGWGWEAGIIRKVDVEEKPCHELIPENGLEGQGHSGLLLERTMVLDREDDGVGGGEEGAFVDGVHDLTEGDLGCEGVTVVNHRITVISIPTIQLHTTTAREEDLKGK